MANTSRKRPASSHAPASNVSNGGTAYPNAPPSSSSFQQRQSPAVSGIDTLLAKYARHLPPGGSISIRLIKGPSSQSVDPIAARQAAKKAAKAADDGNESDNGGGTGDGPKATNSRSITMPLTFPRMAKFTETVTQPDFVKGLRDGRIYEEEVPITKDESDEEESTAYKPSEGTDPNNPTASNDPSATNKKKKRRWRRNDPRPRRWVLQEKAEFFDRIRKRRQRGSTGGDDGEDDAQPISNQYHGVVESNASKYVLLSVASPTVQNNTPSAPSSKNMATEQICIQPIHGFHTFSQPYKFASLTMEEAENAIEQQRNVVTRYMMHGKLSASQNNSSEAKAALASGVATGGRGSRSLGPTPKAMSRARLLGKLAGGGGGGGGGGDGDGDDEDVMGDVRFSSSKVGGGGGSKARKELLSSLGGDGVTVDDDGVLGGANNSEFGGRRRFGRVAVNKDAADGDNSKNKGAKGGATSTGFEAGAMEEGFYQRDVAAEYEALDYDANEQFDDDDVNVGEDEMMDDGGGFGGGDYESEDDNMVDSDDEEASDDDAFGGMATASGLKAMLARARGDAPANLNGADNNAALATGMDALDASAMNIPENGSGTDGATGTSGGKAIGKFLDGAKKTTKEVEKEKKSSSPEASSASMAAMGIEKDKDGKRLITLEAVRREIWLNNGAITSKRLTKKFDVGKKHPDRQALFKSIVMELCTIKKDADGNKLVLKQHYAKN